MQQDRSIAESFNSSSAPDAMIMKDFAEKARLLDDHYKKLREMRQAAVTTLQEFVRQLERMEHSAGVDGAGTVRLLVERTVEAVKSEDFTALINAARAQAQIANDAERAASLKLQQEKEKAVVAEKEKAVVAEKEKAVVAEKAETQIKPPAAAGGDQTGDGAAPKNSDEKQNGAAIGPSAAVEKKASTPSAPKARPELTR